MQSAVNLYSNSKAFDEDFAFENDFVAESMDDFAMIDTQNEDMKNEIEAMERMFS